VYRVFDIYVHQEAGMLRLADAQRMIAAAQKKAAEIGQPMNIAIADAGGNLIAHVRMDARGKDGKVVGAIGVSGGSGDQDHAVAEAGAQAL
jgi:uncharacterized protein GlcG (DUF336 family)